MSVPPLSVNGSIRTGGVPSLPIDPRKILSIQSHVVSGYVGNRAATFPLQLLGWDVDVVNTVQFSNHTGYGHTTGTRTSDADLSAIFNGLKANGLLRGGRLLTGYVPGAAALQVVGELVHTLRTDNPNLVFLMDPVMGDHGTLYVADDVIPLYKSLLPLATIITPNQFEAETLSGIAITSMDTLHDLLHHLHTVSQVPNVIISSFSLPSEYTDPASPSNIIPPAPPASFLSALLPAIPADFPSLLCAASNYNFETKKMSTWMFGFPTIPGYFSGVGDLFSALTLAHFDPEQVFEPGEQSPVATAASHGLASTQLVLLKTHLHSAAHESDDSDEEADSDDLTRRVKRMRRRELRVVQGRKDIESGGTWEGIEVVWD